MMPVPVDIRSALDSANESDMVQKKLSIDAMRSRVSGGPSKESKLREACEGFESIFLQKMWEQMRKNVKKEGYLHSKDEEAYQSMFDVELAKKMASAGGIGLADMLYEQLGQKLHNVSKTTGSGTLRTPLPIEPARPPKPAVEAPVIPLASVPADLYSEPEPAPFPEEAQELTLTNALQELEASRDPVQDPANATYPMFDLQTGTPLNPVAGRMKENSEFRREITATPLLERVSPPGRARPSNAISTAKRSSRQARRNAKIAADEQPHPLNARTDQTNTGKQSEGVGRVDTWDGVSPAEPISVPANALGTGQGAWPVRGDVVSFYGRQPDDSWNTGVSIAVAPGSSVTAPLDGVVSRVEEKDGLSQLILAHDGGLTSHFINAASHLGEGDRVTMGMEIAKIPLGREFFPASASGAIDRMGFEVRRGELAINPEIILG